VEEVEEVEEERVRKEERRSKHRIGDYRLDA
jgi:hypothetical protein